MSVLRRKTGCCSAGSRWSASWCWRGSKYWWRNFGAVLETAPILMHDLAQFKPSRRCPARLPARPAGCADDAVLAHRLKPAPRRRLRVNHCCIEEKVTKTLKVYRARPLTSPSGYGIVTAINSRQICCTEQVPSAPVMNCRRGLKKANPSKVGDAKSPVYKASAS